MVFWVSIYYSIIIKSATVQPIDIFVLTYGYNVHNYSPFLHLWHDSSPQPVMKTCIYVNALVMAYYPIIEMSTTEYINKMLGNVIETLK